MGWGTSKEFSGCCRGDEVRKVGGDIRQIKVGALGGRVGPVSYRVSQAIIVKHLAFVLRRTESRRVLQGWKQILSFCIPLDAHKRMLCQNILW